METNMYFLYGFPASGKTTFSQKLQKELKEKGIIVNIISADKIREELYGSQDKYGNPQEIYEKILYEMKECLNNNTSFIYDACNLYKSYRLDYLNELKKYLDCRKTIIRINTTKEICEDNHKKRNRNFDLKSLEHYFYINEPPSMEEGWDEILDYSYQSDSKRFYLASPFFGKEEREKALEIAEYLRGKGHTVFVPLEHKFSHAWDIPNYEWGRNVFNLDIKGINASNVMICLSYGRISSAGTNFEAGYAYGIGKPIIVIEMPEVKLMSLMLSNCAKAVIKYKDYKNFDFNKIPNLIDYEMEQK